MKKTGIIGMAYVGLLLGGCATRALNFTPQQVAPVASKVDAQLVSTNVTLASKSEALGKVEVAGFENELQSLWKTSLEDALGRSAVFRDQSPRRVNLSVKVMKLDVPSAGVVMRTTTIARYQLIDRETGRVVYSTDVETDGRVTGSEAFLGVTRARESVNRSVQQNISMFIERLSSAKLD